MNNNNNNSSFLIVIFSLTVVYILLIYIFKEEIMYYINHIKLESFFRGSSVINLFFFLTINLVFITIIIKSIEVIMALINYDNQDYYMENEYNSENMNDDYYNYHANSQNDYMRNDPYKHNNRKY